MCKERIENTALDNKAITANWNVVTHQLTITYDSTKPPNNKFKKIAEAGHDNGEFKAPDDVL